MIEPDPARRVNFELTSKIYESKEAQSIMNQKSQILVSENASTGNNSDKTEQVDNKRKPNPNKISVRV